MLRIRLTRVGKKKQPAYRLVVADSRSPRDGAFVEIVGHYNPLTDPSTISVKQERVDYWLAKGAKPSDSAARILARAGAAPVAAATITPAIADITEEAESENPSEESEPTAEP
ncbi:MAG TPA: 30S ribosomal protein S16 [Dehalococcoidia bacterium]|nr:30S ribosomal protein S16 [Dehalococcoidia bacterium]